MILKSAWIVPIASPPIRDGYVEIAGDRIQAVGASADLPNAGEAAIDLGETALTPGLVNPHAHLELTCYADMLKPAGLWDWFINLMKLRRRPGQMEREREAVRAGAWQSLRAGVTCVGDISRCNYAWPALKEIPIRKVSFVELITIADQPPRNLDELRAAAGEVVEDDLLTVGVSPHAPYSVSAEHMSGVLRLADELERPWTMHLAETPEEIAFLHGKRGVMPSMIEALMNAHGLKPPAVTPMDLLEQCGGGRRRGSIAHANYMGAEQFERLAASGQVVIFCPRSHDFFGHSPHPLPEMLSAGVAAAIGTDSLASNRSLSMLDELHFTHTRMKGSPTPTRLMEMATMEGARALDLEHLIGSITPGKQADLAAFPCPASTTDPARRLVEAPKPAQRVWVAGRQVIPDADIDN